MATVGDGVGVRTPEQQKKSAMREGLVEELSDDDDDDAPLVRAPRPTPTPETESASGSAPRDGAAGDGAAEASGPGGGTAALEMEIERLSDKMDDLRAVRVPGKKCLHPVLQHIFSMKLYSTNILTTTLLRLKCLQLRRLRILQALHAERQLGVEKDVTIVRLVAEQDVLKRDAAPRGGEGEELEALRKQLQATPASRLWRRGAAPTLSAARPT